MSAACPVIAKDFVFYLVFHICTGLRFCLADLSPGCGFQKAKGGGERDERLGSIIAMSGGAGKKRSQLRAACCCGGAVALEEQWAQGAGQQWKTLPGDGGLMLPPLFLSIFSSRFVPPIQLLFLFQ